MIRVLIADDSAFSRVTLSRMIESDPGVKVVATAVNGADAIRQIVARQPDLITLDLDMPDMDGFSVLRWLAANRPIPAIVVSSRDAQDDIFRALDLGAVDFVVKPRPKASLEYAKLESLLLEKIHAAALSHPRPTVLAPETPVPAIAPVSGHPAGLILLGASTGGPGALATIFSALPRLPSPIVCAQHMPSGFTVLFAERLTRISRFPVVEARDGEAIVGGRAYLAPGGAHLEVEGDASCLSARIFPRGEGDFYSPSVDRLFVSGARVAGESAVAVVLTGMGCDGRAGIVAVRRAGGRTLAESEETAVVYGMPREAAQSGAVEEVIPLPEIAGRIVELVAERAAVSHQG